MEKRRVTDGNAFHVQDEGYDRQDTNRTGVTLFVQGLKDKQTTLAILVCIEMLKLIKYKPNCEALQYDILLKKLKGICGMT